MTPRYVLIEESEHGFDARGACLFDDEGEALVARNDENEDAARHCIPVIYRLFELTEVIR